MTQHRLTAHRWQAITTNQKSADGQFWYGVQTTGIFCKPSCPSRVPKRQNVKIFVTVAEAIQSGFRPCKRCQPTGRPVSELDWQQQTTNYLEQHFAEPLTAHIIAEAMHGSESSLRHSFQKQTGQTPLQYLQHFRLSKAAALLHNTTFPVSLIAEQVGIHNQTYFITQFKQVFTQTPKQFRLNGPYRRRN